MKKIMVSLFLVCGFLVQQICADMSGLTFSMLPKERAELEISLQNVKQKLYAETLGIRMPCSILVDLYEMQIDALIDQIDYIDEVLESIKSEIKIGSEIDLNYWQYMNPLAREQ